MRRTERSVADRRLGEERVGAVRDAVGEVIGDARSSARPRSVDDVGVAIDRPVFGRDSGWICGRVPASKLRSWVRRTSIPALST